MRIGRAHDVLRMRRVQQRYRQHVHGPERVRQVTEELVGQRIQEHGVETMILVREGPARGGELLHLLDDGVDCGVLAAPPRRDHLLGQGIV